MPSDSIETFEARMNARVKQLEQGIEKTIAKAAEAVGKQIITTTPVDTGRARLNWQTTIDRPAQGSRPAPADPSSGKAAAIRENEIVSKAYKIGHTVCITNNVPYIKKLNKGSSKQAPAMFVEAAVEAGVNSVKSARILK